MAVNTTVEVVMPPMGDSVSEGSVLEWHKQEGDVVAPDETLVEISTDKVDAEVPAPVAGTVVKVHAAEGDTVTVGTVLAEIATDGRAEGAQLMKGAAAMLARYMDESREIPTATSFRTITVTVMDGRRKELKAAGHKVSYTHLIAYAIARAATDQMPVMARHFAAVDGKPHVVDDGQVNLGIAVDVERNERGRGGR